MTFMGVVMAIARHVRTHQHQQWLSPEFPVQIVERRNKTHLTKINPYRLLVFWVFYWILNLGPPSLLLSIWSIIELHSFETGSM